MKRPARTSVSSIDPARYAGVWFEAARKPTFFQRRCARSTAEYQLLPDGKLSVLNTCSKTDGSKSSISGSATSLNPPANSRFEVRFNKFVTKLIPRSRNGNYWIYDLAPDYSWAIVGTEKKNYLWILTRTEDLASSSVDALIAKAADLGFDTSDVIRASAPAKP